MSAAAADVETRQACVLLAVVDESAAALNLPLQMTKCACHVPALCAAAPETWHQPGRDLIDRVAHQPQGLGTVPYTHLRAHETGRKLVCRTRPAT